ASVVAVDDGVQLVKALADGLEPGARLVEPAPADLVVTDIEMPQMDGYSASRLLRALGCTVPIVALTAHTGADVEARCREAGRDGFATKPVDLEALLALCTKLLSQSPTQTQTQTRSPAAPNDAAAAPVSSAAPAHAAG